MEHRHKAGFVLKCEVEPTFGGRDRREMLYGEKEGKSRRSLKILLVV